MGYFLSCDWGTSALRIGLVDDNTLKVIGEIQSENGVAVTHQSWLKSNLPESERVDFYVEILRTALEKLETMTGISLAQIPLVVSGMASSSLGMMELPYKKIPFSTDGSDLQIHKIKANDAFDHDITLISGVRSDQDVMRGEETQLIGVTSESTKQLFILPGTHSKHVFIEGNLIIDFKTYMTGEFFELLASKSSLTNTLGENGSIDDPDHYSSFIKGVKEGIQSNIMNVAFQTRVNHLFGQASKSMNYYFLSGVLIGHELNELKNVTLDYVMVIGNDHLNKLYQIALQEIGCSNVSLKSGAVAVVKGHSLVVNIQLDGN